MPATSLAPQWSQAGTRDTKETLCRDGQCDSAQLLSEVPLHLLVQVSVSPLHDTAMTESIMMGTVVRRQTVTTSNHLTPRLKVPGPWVGKLWSIERALVFSMPTRTCVCV